jgi:hypothetical protein
MANQIRPSRATLFGLLVGTGLAIAAAMGPLVSAMLITIGVETQVGDASGLPHAWMLPATLEGVGMVALIFLLTRRPAGGLRIWCALLIVVSLGAGMAAQGAHATWYDEQSHRLVLPWHVKLLISFVPPVSGLASLHLVVSMVEDLIGRVRLHLAEAAEKASDGVADETPVDPRILRLVRARPRTTWRIVKERTGLSDANAKRALTAARKKLRTETETVEAVPAHPKRNGELIAR